MLPPVGFVAMMFPNLLVKVPPEVELDVRRALGHRHLIALGMVIQSERAVGPALSTTRIVDLLASACAALFVPWPIAEATLRTNLQTLANVTDAEVLSSAVALMAVRRQELDQRFPPPAAYTAILDAEMTPDRIAGIVGQLDAVRAARPVSTRNDVLDDPMPFS